MQSEPMLGFFQPMLAGRYLTFTPGFAQPKLDGIRCIARSTGLFTRTGGRIVTAPHIEAALASFFRRNPDAVLDGELYNHTLRDNFDEIVRLVQRRRPDAAHLQRTASLIQYHVYDLASEPGEFSRRYRSLLKQWPTTPSIELVDTEEVRCERSYDALHRAWLLAGYEGSMWRGDGDYVSRRSASLLKRKSHQDQEYLCLAIEPGRGAYADKAKRVLCKLADGRTFRANVEASHARARELLHEQHAVVTVRHCGFTPGGIPRFPVATKFWGTQRSL